MDKTIIVGKNVKIGKSVVFGQYVIIGKDLGKLPLSIGNHSIIRSHTVIYGGNIIGSYFQTGHGVLIRENNNIGDKVSIGSHSIVEHHVTIADNVRIHSNTFIPEYTYIEEDAWIGPCVVFTNSKYPKSPTAKQNLKGPVVKKGAKIGANVTILPGITIGKNALIGAGSVVVNNVPDNAVVIGNPAHVINSIENLPYV